MQFRGGMNELMRQAARMQRKIDQMYCQELAAPQPVDAPSRESAIVAGDESRAASRAGK